MKKISVLLTVILLGLATVSAQEKKSSDASKSSIKYEVYNRTGSSGFFEYNLTQDEVSFGGMYSTFSGSVTSDFFQVVAKAKIKLSSATKPEELATSSSWDKAWIAFTVPAYTPLRIYGGHGYVLTLPGTFFNMTEEYADGSRWGKDGAALTLSNDIFTWGASFYSTTTSYILKDKLQFGTGVNVNFAPILNLPLSAGISLIYNNGKNYKTVGKTTDYGELFTDSRDYSGAIFAQYKIDRNNSVSLGYGANTSAMTSSSSFKRVENYKTPELAHSHTLSLISVLKFNDVKIEEEAEGAKTFDGDFYSIYGGLRVKAKVSSILYLYPSVQYFGVFDSENSDFGRDSLVLYPRITLEKGSHYFMAGLQFERREMKNDEYDWIMSFPMYYKYTFKNR